MQKLTNLPYMFLELDDHAKLFYIVNAKSISSYLILLSNSLKMAQL